MENPYKILGVSEDATDDQVRNAYRELSKKYHPDLRADNSNPDADDMMAKINAAYDDIMLMRRNKSSSGDRFSDIRRLINQKRILEAEELLDGVPEVSRNAEWNFLKGSVLYSKGWFNDAYTHFERATRMDPSNGEYSAAYNRMNNQRSGNFSGGYHTGSDNPGCSTCDVCSSLLCADCCCEAMGGDCIPCC